MAIKLKNHETEEPKVYGNENFGIPDDCTKKQKFSTIKLVFYIFAVAAICITGYKYYSDALDKYLPEITYDKTSQPLIYHTSDGITVKTQRGIVYDIEAPYQDSIVTSSAKSASQGKSLFFLSKNDAVPDSCDLLMYTTDGDSTVVLDTGVTDFKINPDGRYVAYRKGTELYVSDTENTRLIHRDVSEYFLSENNQVITFFSSNDSAMYTCNTSADETPVLVNMNITKLVSPKNEYSEIYFIKNNALYSIKYDGTQKLISENVTDAIMFGNTVYYTVQEEYERKLTDFFIDELKSTDELLTEPDGNDFISESRDLSFFDEQAFAEATELYNSKLLRDEIRTHFEENPSFFYGYSLYCINNERTILTDTHLVSPYLRLNSCQSILTYKKYDTEITDRINLLDITSLEEATEHRDNLLNIPPDEDMYMLREGKKPFFALELPLSGQIEISLDGKYLYCIENNENSETGTLAKYEIGSSTLKNRTEIQVGATDFALDGSDSDAVMVFNGNSLSFYTNNTLTHLSDSSCHEFFYVDNTLFYYDQYDYTTNSGNLLYIRNGEITPIDTNVRSFKVRRYNNISYIKDFDEQTGTGVLYEMDGSKIKRVDSYVGSIVN